MRNLSIAILIAAQCGAHAASIDGISYGISDNGKYELIFENVGKIPRDFTTANPDSIVLDFADTDSNIKEREINIATNGIYDVDVIEGLGRTRAVVNLAIPKNYTIHRRDRDIVLIFDDAGIGEEDDVHFPVMVTAPTISNSGALFNSFSTTIKRENEQNTPFFGQEATSSISNNQNTWAIKQVATSKQPTLDPVYMQRNGGVGLLSFTLPRSVSNVNIRQDGNKIIAYLNGFYVAKSEQKRMEVDSYATPVNNVDILGSARGTELVLNIKQNAAFEYASYQNGDVYSIEVKPAVVDNSLQEQVDELQGFSPTKHYHGAPMSLNFQDIEVRAVLQIIAEFTNNNIVVSDAVTGSITLRLDSVPWDQALDIILKTKGLGMRENGSVVYIAPASELDQRELDALKVIQERDQLVPARTELIQVKYAKAEDIAKILEKSRENSGGNGTILTQDSILSGKGTVSVDVRTNTLLVSDIPSKLQAVRNLVVRLDEPVRQVLVDARLVLTSDNFTRDLGARFGLTFLNANNSRLITGSGSSEAADSLGESIYNAALGNVKGEDATIANPGLSNRLGVNMPVAGSSYGLAILGADFLVDLELSALQTEGKAEIISSPRVVTQDGKQASIATGQQIPYETVSSNGTQVEFQNAELSLDVTPRIAPDNRVDLLLNVTNDKPDPSIRSTAGNVGITTNHLETNVLVDNGETIVLGGVYQQQQSVSTNKVPLLGDLPIIGNAFKTTNKRFNKSELLIFVTPRIIDNNLSDYDKFSNLRN